MPTPQEIADLVRDGDAKWVGYARQKLAEGKLGPKTAQALKDYEASQAQKSAASMAPAAEPEGFLGGLTAGIKGSLGGVGRAIGNAIEGIPEAVGAGISNVARGLTYDHADDILAVMEKNRVASERPQAGRGINAPLVGGNVPQATGRGTNALTSLGETGAEAEQAVHDYYAKRKQEQGLGGKIVQGAASLVPGVMASMALPAVGAASVPGLALAAGRGASFARGALGVLGDMGIAGGETALLTHGENPEATAADYGRNVGPSMLLAGPLSATVRGLGAGARAIANKKTLPIDEAVSVSPENVLYSGSQTSVDVRHKMLRDAGFVNEVNVPGVEGHFAKAGWVPPLPSGETKKSLKTAGDYLQQAADQAKQVEGGVDAPLAASAARLAAKDVAPDAADVIIRNRTIAQDAEAAADEAFRLSPEAASPKINMDWVDDHLAKWEAEMTQGDVVMDEPLRDAYDKLRAWSRSERSAKAAAEAEKKAKAEKALPGAAGPGSEHPMYSEYVTDAQKAGKNLDVPVGMPMASGAELETLIDLVRDSVKNTSFASGKQSTTRERVATDTYNALLGLRKKHFPGWAKRKKFDAEDIEKKQHKASAYGFNIDNPTSLRETVEDRMSSAPSDATGKTGLEELQEEFQYAQELPDLLRKAEAMHPTGAADDAIAAAEENARRVEQIMKQAKTAKALAAFRAHVAEVDPRTSGYEAVKNRLLMASRATRSAAYEKLRPGPKRKLAGRGIVMTPGVMQGLSAPEEN